MASYAVDPERVYLTGLSCGDGRDAWKQRGCELGLVPIWAFHGEQDDSIDLEGKLVSINGLAECDDPSPLDARATIYPGVGHDLWTVTYDLSSGNDIYAWMLTHRNE